MWLELRVGWDEPGCGGDQLVEARSCRACYPKTSGPWLQCLRSFPWLQWERIDEKESRATAGMKYQPWQ